MNFALTRVKSFNKGCWNGFRTTSSISELKRPKENLIVPVISLLVRPVKEL